MFENMTEKEIWQRMMRRVPASRDKREGSIIFDSTVPAAIEIMLAYAQLDWYIDNSFGDTSEREFLIRLALERGISPEPATKAVLKGVFVPEDINLIGQRFSVGVINYRVTAIAGIGEYFLECETAGRIGNVYTGQLIPIEYIDGLESANILELTVPGEDEEETEAFRKRYLKTFSVNSYGGNISDYKEKVTKIDGVGGVKVHPIWNGGGTVRVVFATSENEPPTPDFVSKVQEIVDPIPYKQLGVGIAPIGHFCTVEGCVNSEIKIDLTIIFVSGISFEQMRSSIENVVDEYFQFLNKEWESTQVVTLDEFYDSGLVVRISQIESRILELPNIIDIKDTLLNGKPENLLLQNNQLAVRGILNG